MRENPLTPEILLETLKRSSLKTVLVEGSDDMEVYRKVERIIGVRNIDLLPTGGKTALLKVFQKRNELNSSRVMFIADKDAWVFSNVPEEYEEVFLTNGYCIENDLFSDGSDLVLNLLDQSERERFLEIVKNVTPWYAFEVKKINGEIVDSPFSDVTLLSEKVLNRANNALVDTFLESRNYSSPCPVLCADIQENFALKLRGKYIFQILEIIFQERKAEKALKYHRRQLFDLCFVEGTRDNSKVSNLNSVISEIAKFIK